MANYTDPNRPPGAGYTWDPFQKRWVMSGGANVASAAPSYVGTDGPRYPDDPEDEEDEEEDPEDEEEGTPRVRRTPIAETAITQRNLDRLLKIQKDRLAVGKGGTPGNPRPESVISRRIALIRKGLAGGGGGGGGGASGAAELLDPWTGQFTPPDMAAAARDALGVLPDVPRFEGPSAPSIDPFSFREYEPSDPFSYDPFQAPTPSEVTDDPGFQFRLDEGLQALQNAAASKGLLRSGGTLKDFVKYGQGFASNEFQNVYNRAASTYDRNYGTSADIYDRNVLNRRSDYLTDYRTAADIHGVNTANIFGAYDRQLQGAQAELAPRMTGYSTQAQAAQRGSELAYDRSWRQYLTDWEIFERNQQKVHDRLFKQQEFDQRMEIATLPKF
jgi:hypothetical protein